VETLGRRLIKYDSEGNQLWVIGEPGLWGDDNSHFGSYWGGIEGNPAIDKDHKVYVADTANNRIQIFNGDGTFHSTFGSYGQENDQFDFPTHIFIDPDNGNIYITDTYNHRIQVYSSDLIYKGTIGVTAESGNDNSHFACPQGVVVDQYGYIYVGDFDNTRIQKCVLNGGDYTCETFIGETGAYDWNFGHVAPQGLAIDNAGRIYVSDNWAARIQVFDSNGAFLTSIEGNNSAALGYPIGISVDQNGFIYVAIRENHAIQIFSPGIPNWVQSNINGFGDKNNAQIPAMAAFNGYLYAGTWKDGETADYAEIWRTADGSVWEKVDSRQVDGCADMIEYDGYLYCGSWDGRIWRTYDGTTWTEENTEGFGYDYAGIARFAVFESVLYASTWADGTEIWRTDDGINWEIFAEAGLNEDLKNVAAISSETYNGYLYWGVANWETGAQLWKTDGNLITQVISDDLETSYNYAVSALSSFDGYLYASLVNDNGIEVLRSNDDLTWESILLLSDEGSGAHARAGLEVNQNELFLIAQNSQTGTEVWKTANGTHWKQIGFEGFGDSNNESIYFDNGVTIFNDILYTVGGTNFENGGEIWRYEDSDSNIYLPLILNNYQEPVENIWKKVTSPTNQTLNAVKMLSANDGWAVGDAGTILRWNGSNWSEFSSTTTNNLNGLALLDGSNAWAVGDSGTILKWNGSTWQSYTSPTSLRLNEIHLLNANNGWIVGEGGTLLHWNGSGWQSWTSPTTYDLYALDFLSDTDGWAVGGLPWTGTGTSEILKWNGSEWSVYVHEHSLQAIDVLYDIDMVSPTFGIALGHNNNGERWNGYYWTWYNPDTAMIYHHGVHFLSENDGWSVGWHAEERNILHWENNEWNSVPSPVTSTLMDVFMIDSNHGWIVGTEGVILRYGN
jgi:DNA-binding beta-propeller fold protein YncE